MRCPCIDNGACPAQPVRELKAMEKRLLEGVDELYKLNNLDTELASEHDDRLEALEQRVAALEARMERFDGLLAEAWSWAHELREAGGPEPATGANPARAGEDKPAQQQRDSRTATQQPRSCETCRFSSRYTMQPCPPGGEDCDVSNGLYKWQPREGGLSTPGAAGMRERKREGGGA